MTKPKYDTLYVKYIDENGEIEKENYIDVIRHYYISCSDLAKKIGTSSRSLQRQIESGKYNFAFQYFFGKRIRTRKNEPDSKIGDFIGYPIENGKKYISSQLREVILKCHDNPDLITYFNEQKRIKASKEHARVNHIFLASSDEYKMNIENELDQLKESIKEQEKKYTNEYRRSFINDLINSNNLIDSIIKNNLTKEELIKQILDLGKKKNQRIRFSEQTNETLKTLEENINNLLVDYEAALKGIELKNYPYWIDSVAGKSWKTEPKIPNLASKCIRIVDWA